MYIYHKPVQVLYITKPFVKEWTPSRSKIIINNTQQALRNQVTMWWRLFQGTFEGTVHRFRQKLLLHTGDTEVSFVITTCVLLQCPLYFPLPCLGFLDFLYLKTVCMPPLKNEDLSPRDHTSLPHNELPHWASLNCFRPRFALETVRTEQNISNKTDNNSFRG